MRQEKEVEAFQSQLIVYRIKFATFSKTRGYSICSQRILNFKDICIRTMTFVMLDQLSQAVVFEWLFFLIGFVFRCYLNSDFLAKLNLIL